MKYINIVAAAASLAGSAIAYPSLERPYGPHLSPRQDPNPFLGVPAGGVRAPCPGLNTLANHGYINNDGKDITIEAVTNGFLAAFSMGIDATTPGAQNAINLCSAVSPQPCTGFNLDQMSIPHQIEHDASLRAEDAQMAYNINSNNANFNNTIWGFTKQAYGDITHIDLGHANKARLTRIQEAQQQDYPGWFVENDGGSSTEHAFYLSTMHDTTVNQDPWNPQAKLEWLNYWITNERLPTAVGWSKPTVTLAGSYITSLAASVISAPTPASKVKARNTKRFDNAALPKQLQAANADQVQQAAAAATASAGVTAPTFPNPYSENISPAQFKAMNVTTNNYRQKVQAAFESALQGLVGGGA